MFHDYISGHALQRFYHLIYRAILKNMVNRNKNLENRLKNSNWAYTGSLAMKIHANRLGIPLNSNRRIGNINIAARDPLGLIPMISAKRWVLKSSPEYKHTKFYNSNRNKLNLFPANGRLAPRMNNVQRFGNVPVMSLRALLKQKLAAKNNSFGVNNKMNKNIEFLKLLISKNVNANSPRARSRSRSRSRSRTRSPPIRRMRSLSRSPSYDPFGPPKNLFNNRSTKRTLRF